MSSKQLSREISKKIVHDTLDAEILEFQRLLSFWEVSRVYGITLQCVNDS